MRRRMPNPKPPGYFRSKPREDLAGGQVGIRNINGSNDPLTVRRVNLEIHTRMLALAEELHCPVGHAYSYAAELLLRKWVTTIKPIMDGRVPQPIPYIGYKQCRMATAIAESEHTYVRRNRRGAIGLLQINGKRTRGGPMVDRLIRRGIVEHVNADRVQITELGLRAIEKWRPDDRAQ